MPPILSFVGQSASGKTTLIEKLIPVLRQRGYRVGVVKHAHRGFEMDRTGKDSFRHRQAGAQTVMVAAPGQIAMVKTWQHDRLEALLPFFDDVDLLIAEGFKRETVPKIEVFRSELHRQPACLGDDNLVALVTDAPLEVDLPRFSPDHITAIIQFIVGRFLHP